MTGIAIATASVQSGSAVSPISTTLSWTGSNPYNVAGASGLSSDNFNYAASGGVPPYTFSVGITSNPSGKLDMTAITNTSGPGTFRTIWGSFTVGESESIGYRLTVTDNVGTVAQRAFTLTVKRTS